VIQLVTKEWFNGDAVKGIMPEIRASVQAFIFRHLFPVQTPAAHCGCQNFTCFTEQMVEVMLVEDSSDSGDGIGSLIAELSPPPKHTVVEIGGLPPTPSPPQQARLQRQAKPASTRFPPTAKKGPAI
jgi:hypothetical protein